MSIPVFGTGLISKLYVLIALKRGGYFTFISYLIGFQSILNHIFMEVPSL